MSRDWPIAVLVAVGHAGIVVYLTNVLHALGLSKRRMEALKYGFLAVVIALSAAVASDVLQHPWREWSPAVRAYAVACLGMSVVGIPVSSALLRLRRNLRRNHLPFPLRRLLQGRPVCARNKLCL